MRATLTIVFLCCTYLHVNGQNLLSSLYNLEPFPEEMEWGKTLIDQLGDDTLIYNFIGGGGRDGVNIFQFDLRSKKGLNIKLPLTDPINILTTGDSNKELSKEASFYLNCKFLLTRYQDLDDPLTVKDFSLKNIFIIASQRYNLDAYGLVNEVLTNYDSALDYKDKRIEFFNKLAEALEIKDVDFKQLSEDQTAEDYTHREIEETLLDHILEEVEDYEQLIAVIYETFLEPLGKEEIINKKMDRIFFDGSVVSRIEREILQPVIEINSSQNMFLDISDAYVIKNKESIGAFAFDMMTVSIDFKNQHIVLEFEKQIPQDITFNDRINLPSSINSSTVNISRIRLVVSKEKLVYEFLQPSRYYNDVNEPIVIDGNR